MMTKERILGLLSIFVVCLAKPQPTKLKSEECRDPAVHAIPDFIEMPALGRSFGTGMLYDTHSDQLVQEYTVCPKEKLHQTEERKLDHQLIDSVVTFTRPSAKLTKNEGFRIPPDLQVSIAGELVEVKNEGGWIFDVPPNATSVKASFIEQYMWRDTKVDSVEQCFIHFALSPLVAQATHYVSEINHGSAHVIVLEKAMSEFEASQPTTKTLIELGNMIRRGDAKDLTQRDSKFLSNVKVRIYSSRGAGATVKTVDDLITYYKEKPFLARESAEPVWIKLKRLPTSNGIIQGIGDYTTGKLQYDFIDAFHNNYFLAQKLLKSPAVAKVPPYEKRLKAFSANLLDYRHKFSKSFGEVVVKYRSGTAKQCEVAGLTENWNKSLFSDYRLKMWLDLVAEELYQIEQSLKKLNTIPFAEKLNWIKDRSDCAVGLVFHVNATSDDRFLMLQNEYLNERLFLAPKDDGLDGIWAANTGKIQQKKHDRPVERFLEAFVEFAGDASFLAAYETIPSDNFAELTFSDACPEKLVNGILSLNLD